MSSMQYSYPCSAAVPDVRNAGVALSKRTYPLVCVQFQHKYPGSNYRTWKDQTRLVGISASLYSVKYRRNHETQRSKTDPHQIH